MLLAGDIGGTKTNLAIFSPESLSRGVGLRAALAQGTFASANHPSLEAIAREFLSQVELEIDRAAFGVAGPVVDDRAQITNLPWVIDAARVREALALSSVELLNDLEAIASAVPFLASDDLHTLNVGQPEHDGAIAVIAPGTGLGEAYLTWKGGRYHAHASEGGHTSFAPNDPLQIDLLRYLQERFGHVSWERVCSGQGIPNIYAFLKDSGRAQEPEWLAERLATAVDPAPVISGAALNGETDCEICSATLDLFVSLLGAEAGNLAITILATGGVYLGGGIPPRILPLLERGRFMDAFRYKGRMADLLVQMPVHVIMNPKAALLGAACHALEL
jgi:glucokinase